jgi:hypothetical protein
MNITTIQLVLFVAAVWRLSNLLANEDGPFHFFKTLRSKIARAEVRSRRKNGFLSKLHLYEGVNCEYCNSIWFGCFFAATHLIAPSVALALAFPLALSTGAILIKKVVFVLGGIDTYFDLKNNPKVVVEKSKPITVDWDGLYQKQSLEKGGSNHA